MTNIDFFKLQVCQHEHDLDYHNDILSLGTEDRTKHLVLHLSKYLWHLIEDGIQDITIADIFICSLSQANALNFKIDIETHGKDQTENNSQVFIQSYGIAVGKMAKACEAIDHLESYPSRDVLIDEIRNILSLTLLYSKMNDIDITSIVKSRLHQIEQNYLFTKTDRNKPKDSLYLQ